MENLNELRKELKKIDCNVRIKTLSFGKSATFICGGEEITYNVFSPDQLKKFEKLFTFCKLHKEEIYLISKNERISGLTEYC